MTSRRFHTRPPTALSWRASLSSAATPVVSVVVPEPGADLADAAAGDDRAGRREQAPAVLGVGEVDQSAPLPLGCPGRAPGPAPAGVGHRGVLGGHHGDVVGVPHQGLVPRGHLLDLGPERVDLAVRFVEGVPEAGVLLAAACGQVAGGAVAGAP